PELSGDGAGTDSEEGDEGVGEVGVVRGDVVADEGEMAGEVGDDKFDESKGGLTAWTVVAKLRLHRRLNSSLKAAPGRTSGALSRVSKDRVRPSSPRLPQSLLMLSSLSSSSTSTDT